MTMRIFGAYDYIGGAAGDLDNILQADHTLVTGDMAIVIKDNDTATFFTYDATASGVNNETTHPY